MFNRRTFINNLIGELTRYWFVFSLLYFLAVGAEIHWLKALLTAYLIGVPIVLVTAFSLVFGAALVVYVVNRRHWQPPHNAQRSLTDIRRMDA